MQEIALLLGVSMLGGGVMLFVYDYIRRGK